MSTPVRRSSRIAARSGTSPGPGTSEAEDRTPVVPTPTDDPAEPTPTEEPAADEPGEPQASEPQSSGRRDEAEGAQHEDAADVDDAASDKTDVNRPDSSSSEADPDEETAVEAGDKMVVDGDPEGIDNEGADSADVDSGGAGQKRRSPDEAAAHAKVDAEASAEASVVAKKEERLDAGDEEERPAKKARDASSAAPTTPVDLPSAAHAGAAAASSQAAAAATPTAAAAESDDDGWDEWGIAFTDDEKDKKDVSLAKEIEEEKKAAPKAWEKENAPIVSKDADIASDTESAFDDGPNFGASFAQADKKQQEVDSEGEFFDKEPQASWSMWAPHSHESMMATTLVQKIRVRLGKADVPGGEFPSPELSQVLKRFVTQRKEEQRILIAALLWIEASVIEVDEQVYRSYTNLNEDLMTLLKNELDTLKKVCSSVPDAVLLTKAASKLPSRAIRRRANEIQKKLTTELYTQLVSTGGDFGDEQDLADLITEYLGHLPKSVRILALTHAYEFRKLIGADAYDDLDELALAFAKQQSPERGFEMVCRQTLTSALDLAEKVLTEEVDKRRSAKLDSLRRLHMEWKLDPTEEQISQLHVLPMEKQCSILLNVERDIEIYWCRTLSTTKSEEDRAEAMRKFINFPELINSYLRDDNSKGLKLKPLENEAGVPFTILEMGEMRKSIATIFRKLKERYGWVPDMATRRACAKIPWVAQLSSLLYLARMPLCNHVDEELRRLLQKEQHVKLNQEVLQRFKQWINVEGSDGFELKRHNPRVLEEHDPETEENRRLYRDYLPDAGALPTGEDGGYATMTPGISAGAPPATPAGTPYQFGLDTPDAFGSRNPGMTPAFVPAGGSMTPGMPTSMTPRWAPPTMPGRPSAPFTPANNSVPFTPAGGPAPSTPVGAGMAVPFSLAAAGPAPFTPAAPAPTTPVAATGRMPTTPRAVPVPAMARSSGPYARIPTTPTAATASRPAEPQSSTRNPFSIPMTPRGAAGSSSNVIPFTPGGPTSGGLIPMTPRAAPTTPREAGMASALGAGVTPMTPGADAGSMPMTPRAAEGRIPTIPRGNTVGSRILGRILSAEGASAAADGRAGAVPFTHAGVIPSTPRALVGGP